MPAEIGMAVQRMHPRKRAVQHACSTRTNRYVLKYTAHMRTQHARTRACRYREHRPIALWLYLDAVLQLGAKRVRVCVHVGCAARC